MWLLYVYVIGVVVIIVACATIACYYALKP